MGVTVREFQGKATYRNGRLINLAFNSKESERNYQNAVKAGQRNIYKPMIAFIGQLCQDAAFIALHQVFGFASERNARFGIEYLKVVNAAGDLINIDDKSDSELVYSRSKIDKAVKAAVGEYFVPWKERYSNAHEWMDNLGENKMKIVLKNNAIMPERAHNTDAGLDLKTPIDFKIEPHSSAVIDTGVCVELPAGTVGFIKSKSGLMVKNDIVTDGTVDVGYTGSIRVKLWNHGDEAVEFTTGSKIAQLVVCRIDIPDIEVVDELGQTERGDNGFGSSGR